MLLHFVDQFDDDDNWKLNEKKKYFWIENHLKNSWDFFLNSVNKLVFSCNQHSSPIPLLLLFVYFISILIIWSSGWNDNEKKCFNFFFSVVSFHFRQIGCHVYFFTFLRWSMMIHVSSGPFSLRFSLLLLFVVHFQITKLEQWSISISVCLFLLCKFNARFDCCLLLFVCCCCLILPYPKKKLLNNNNKNESFFTKKKNC